MRIVVAAVGRLKDGAEQALVERYTARVLALGRKVGIAQLEVKEIGESRAGTSDLRRAEEARGLLSLLPPDRHLVALDETGRALDSAGFARLVGGLRERGTACLAFAVGGPDGHGPQMRETADLMLSLGAMTLPHALARVVLVEQIYRAATILSGHPYHRA